MKRVEVKWVDSKHVLPEWTMLDDLDDHSPSTQEIKTVGFLFRDEPEFVVVLLNDGGDQISDGIAIPRCAIRELRELDVSVPFEPRAVEAA